MEEKLTPNPNRLGALQLAYIGDAVYEIYVRRFLLQSGDIKSSSLQQRAEKLVRAQAQHEALEAIRPLLSEEECRIVRRGRNQKHKNKPKNATAQEYNNATGLESLIGYLYLHRRMGRLDEIIQTILHKACQDV